MKIWWWCYTSEPVDNSFIQMSYLVSLTSDSMFSINSTSLKYSKASVTDGSRLLLVCDVALGHCRDVYKRDPTLTQAPEGHHSVHGVHRTPNTPSEFEVGVFVCDTHRQTDKVKMHIPQKSLLWFSYADENQFDWLTWSQRACGYR